MALSSAGRLVNPACPVYFAGWRSTTYELQRTGWELSMEQEPHLRHIRLALKFAPGKLYMMSAGVPYEYMEGGGRLPEFHVQHVSSHMTVSLMESRFDFQPVDATPHFVTEERKSIEDFKLFMAPQVRTEQIILPEESVADLLERIRTMQAPHLEVIRERSRRAEPEQMAQPKFHAQILSFAA